jgi:chromosome segregation ATPase
MNNEKYLNYYIELLTSTLNEVIVKNISLQANARVTDELLMEVIKSNDEREKIINKLTSRYNDTNNSLNELRLQKAEFDNTRHQIHHLETFRNELISAREENQRLREEIELLKNPPAKKRKSIDTKTEEINTNKVANDF